MPAKVERTEAVVLLSLQKLRQPEVSCVAATVISLSADRSSKSHKNAKNSLALLLKLLYFSHRCISKNSFYTYIFKKITQKFITPQKS